MCLCEFLRAACLRVPSEVRRDRTPWSWRYRRLYAIWGWCQELNLCSSGEPGTVSTLNQWLMSLALLLFLLIYTGFHLQPSVATMFFSLSLLILCMGVNMQKSGTNSRNGLLSHPACPRDRLRSPASRQALFPAEATCQRPLHQLLCFYDILFFLFVCFLEESWLPVSMAPALDVSVICLSSFG